MRRSRWPILLLVLGLGGVALYGFFRLFVLRFEAGDVYPPYSSLRADPLGTKVLYDALRAAPGFTVERNFQSLSKIEHPANATIFYAGATTHFWPAAEADRLETLAKDGAHVVVSFLPSDERATRKGATPTPSPDTKEADEASRYTTLSDLGKRWGFTPAFPTAKLAQGTSREAAANAVQAGTEPVLSWHTTLYFRDPDSSWHVLYRCAAMPVIMERTFGRGSLVLAADSFALSNEAMRSERAPRLLAWLLGSRSRVIFDETHLGVAENPGIATLLRKYHLQGLLGAIAVLAGLFVWQTACPFLPTHPDEAGEQIVAGKDSFTGFVSFLRRGIAPSRLIEVCLDQWKKSVAARPGKLGAKLPRIEAVAANAGRTPVEAYRTISHILAEKA